MKAVEKNIDDVALIFEGGGMRATYTSGVVRVLLENQIYLADAYGISAGSSHTANYVSRDLNRAYASFVDFFSNPKAAGPLQFLFGHGYFNSNLIYQESGLPNGVLPFKFERFMNSSTQMHIEAYQADTGKTIHWTKSDVSNLQDLMLRVQASSSMPIFMTTTKFDGHTYLDGGLGDSWGILLDRAMADGYQRFFVVCTQVKGYRKAPSKESSFAKLALRKYPNVYTRMQERWRHYNDICDRLDLLEDQGAAIVFRPRQMEAKSTAKDVNLLRKVAADGYAQAQVELPAWKDFLGI